MVVDDGAGEQRGRRGGGRLDGWSSSRTGQDRQGEAKGYDNNDDKSESDETLSLSSHHKDTAAHHGETAQGAHDSPTRVAARLHPIIARPHDDGGGSPRIPRSAALRSSFTRNTRICYL